MAESIYIGVDVGGTTIKLGLCDQEGQLLHKYEGPTGVEQGSDAIIDNIAAYAKRLVEETSYTWEQVAGVGAGVPGFIDMATGIVRMSPNLGWRDYPATEKLKQKLNKPVLLDNDANVAALGEAWAGAGKGVNDVVCFTLGTGVGGGIIANGKLYTGSRGMAGELGHIQVVPDLEAILCGCGQKGCVETVSSATGIIRMAQDAVSRGDATTLSTVESIAAKDVFDQARAGDEVSQRIIQRAAHYLGKTMGILAVVLNPQRFIVGGGVSRAGDLMLNPVRESFSKSAPPAAVDGVDIVAATLGNDAGIIGAAGLHLRQ